MSDYVIEMLHITKEFPGIKANDDRAFEESLGAMSPFEVKNLLVKMAKKGDEGTTRTLLNAGRGNLAKVYVALPRADVNSVIKIHSMCSSVTIVSLYCSI